MRIRLLTNLKLDDTTTEPEGKVVDVPDDLAQELLALDAALPVVEETSAPAEQTPPPPPADPAPVVPPAAPEEPLPTVVEEMTRAELVLFARATWQVELNPNANWADMVAQVNQLKNVTEA